MRANGDAFGATFTRPSDLYVADSLVSIATVEQLRSARMNYPDWINNTYLQIPENTPQRVLTLARDLTATAPTPYDRAVAIETFLRAYSYTLDLPAPPPNRDVADYFLFDLKRGYCDYFATAMVVLARAAGLPARMVVGYATGTYNPMTAEYVISQADAHSWPEVYFNEYGWVEFEPTSGRAPIERLDATNASPGATQQFPPLQPRYTLSDDLGWILVAVIALMLLLVAPAWFIIDTWRLARLPPRVTVVSVYQRLKVQALALHIPSLPGDTSHELTAKVLQRMWEVSPAHTRSDITPAIANDMQHLAELYDLSVYSPYVPNTLDRQMVMRAWQRTRLCLWQVRFRQLRRWLSRRVL
jgi:hypothetical protein